ncbi:MAG: hypothetical protein NT029_16025 [Armatimonadetes bacterium]|nr:hypothetical protein [Armatimonadota bacterium]
MTARDIVEVVLAAVVVANLVAVGVGMLVIIRRMGDLTHVTQAAIAQIEGEVAETLTEARKALTEVQALSASVVEVTSQHLVPTLEALKVAAERIDALGATLQESAVSVRKVTAAAESIATPTAALVSATRLFASRGGRAGLLTALAGAAAKALFAGRRHHDAGPS